MTLSYPIGLRLSKSLPPVMDCIRRTRFFNGFIRNCYFASPTPPPKPINQAEKTLKLKNSMAELLQIRYLPFTLSYRTKK